MALGKSISEEQLRILKALSERSRVEIMLALAISEKINPSKCLSFSALRRFLGLGNDRGRSQLIYHLGVLEEADLIGRRTGEQPENPGSYRIYDLTDRGRRALSDILNIDSSEIEELAQLARERIH